MTEPLKVMAPIAAPKNSSKRLPLGMHRFQCAQQPCATMPNLAAGSTTAAMAMNTAAKPIMLCMKATSSGILVISTRCAMMAPAPPPITKPSSTQPKPRHLSQSELDNQRCRGEHGNRHARHAKHIAANRGGGVRQAFQGLNESKCWPPNTRGRRGS